MSKSYVKVKRPRLMVEKCLLCGRNVLEGKACDCQKGGLK